MSVELPALVITCFPKENNFDILFLNAVMMAVFGIFDFLQICMFYHCLLDLDSVYSSYVSFFFN